MKHLLYFLLLTCLFSCDVLGIGKQCYTCTVTVHNSGRNAATTTTATTTKDVCGNSDKNSVMGLAGTTTAVAGGIVVTVTTTVQCIAK